MDNPILGVLTKTRDSAGSLQSVNCLVSDNMIVGYQLQFENSKLILQANPNDDTIDVDIDLPEILGQVIQKTSIGSWTGALGTPLFSGWQLQNETGYVDGVRLLFVSSSATIAIELIVEASQIRTYVSEALHEAR